MAEQVKGFLSKLSGEFLFTIMVQVIVLVIFFTNLSASNAVQTEDIQELQQKIEKSADSSSDIKERLARLEANDKIEMQMLQELLKHAR